ncbi:hypothetical protein V8G54_036496 [Vigna mungo]|uniref:Uncharacterized protein n=1 Tax=Vigna mungo TaxID=3915 RepID=A0AAQ3MH12_VIGMU
MSPTCLYQDRAVSTQPHSTTFINKERKKLLYCEENNVLLKTLHHLFPFKQSLLPFSLISDHSSSSSSTVLYLPSIPPTFFQLHPIYAVIYASFLYPPHQTKPCSFTTALFFEGSRASCFSSSSHSKSPLKTTTLTPCLRTNTTLHVTPLAFTSHRRERFPMHRILSTTVEPPFLQ